jgi:hypothetical protein
MELRLKADRIVAGGAGVEIEDDVFKTLRSSSPGCWAFLLGMGPAVYLIAGKGMFA